MAVWAVRPQSRRPVELTLASSLQGRRGPAALSVCKVTSGLGVQCQAPSCVLGPWETQGSRGGSWVR